MTDIVLRDIDPRLRQRIQQVADARGWDLPHALSHLLELGLEASDVRRDPAFDGREADILAGAIAAMEQVPDDPGFALIGRAPAGTGEPSPD